MNGLLHRLAARAAGTAVAVRSDARLPYHGAAFGWADVAEPEVAAPREAAPLVVRSASIASITPIEDGPLPPADVEPALLMPQGVRPVVLSSPLPGQAEAVNQRGARDPEPFGEPAAPAVSEPPPLVRAGMTPAPDDAALLPPIRREPFDRSRGDARRVSLDLEPAAGSRVSRSDVDPVPMMPRIGDRPVAPVALVPAAIRPAPQCTAWPQASPGGTADQSTEVHIHIGRIDVTALHEAPSPRRKPAATPAPMSLDAYLARPRRA